MEYNTSRGPLNVPEYGRNIQKMVDYAITVEDKTERNKIANSIVSIMSQIGEGMKGTDDFKQKIWDQLYLISDFKLEVDSPFPKPSPTRRDEKPEKIKYPTRDMKYKHYGKTVEGLIEKACAMEDGEEKQALVQLIANLMKRCYLNWNRDSVNDDLILQHLEKLSKGKLSVDTSFEFTNTGDILAKTPNNSRRRKPTNNNRNRNNRQRRKN